MHFLPRVHTDWSRNWQWSSRLVTVPDVRQSRAVQLTRIRTGGVFPQSKKVVIKASKAFVKDYTDREANELFSF